MLTPTLKSERVDRPCHGIKTFMKCGEFVEPFVALINHSCEPNAFHVFEGNQLRVRAARDIPAGQELTFNYIGHKGDYDTRTETFMKLWEFTCGCSFCIQGKRGFGDIVQNKLADLEYRKNKPKVVSAGRSLLYLERSIRVMEKAKYGGGSPPILHAYQKTVDIQFDMDHIDEALIAALRTRYVIEPAQQPTLQLHQRLGSLFNLIYLLRSLKLSDEPMLLASDVLPHLMVQYARDVVKCFGVDSMIAKHETGVMSRYAAHRKSLDASWKYVPLATNKVERESFVTSMNWLMEWAELDELTEEQLLR